MQKNIIHQEINETFLFTKDAILSVAKFIPVWMWQGIISRACTASQKRSGPPLDYGYHTITLSYAGYYTILHQLRFHPTEPDWLTLKIVQLKLCPTDPVIKLIIE